MFILKHLRLLLLKEWLVKCNRETTLKSFCPNSQAKILGQRMYDSFGFIGLDRLYIWLYLFSSFLMNILRIIINKKHGSTHRYTGDLLTVILFMTIDMMIKSFNSNMIQLFDWKNLTVVVLLIIACLIYNKNLRIKTCKLALKES